MKLVDDGYLRLIQYASPVRVNFADGEDTAIRDAKIGAGEEESHEVRYVRVILEDVVKDRIAIV